MTLSIEEISDRLEIQDIYTRYVHAADDRESLDNIFLPDTTFDWTSAGGGVMTYKEAKEGPVFTGKLLPWAFHIYTNVRIDVLEGRQKAVVKVKAVNPSGLEDKQGEPMMFQTHGTYTDQLEKTVDGWRITDRIWHEFSVVGPFKKIDGIPGMLESAGKNWTG
ncbi:SnoaL-like domain-containing protein [Fusarium falciforme]|uniref:SnoaL-like domain-containing protein n=1 Tax=Fusarium falciforme TaxID=195108 RepID=UPI002301802B|nr:SnoaL-like domain-containing protein [Fusarium falciforme]WAO87440.1 SnoaL-like domain-containing protein [Fusarium falciforme]